MDQYATAAIGAVPCRLGPQVLLRGDDLVRAFEAAFFVELSRLLQRIQEARADGGDTKIDPMGRERLTLLSQGIKGQTQALNLDCSTATASRMVEALAVNPHLTMEQYGKLSEELQGRLRDELRMRRFFVLSREEADLFDGAMVFPADIHDRYPSASDDMLEAGKCLALMRYTAGVFHLMRVLEHAIVDIAQMVGLKDPKPSWESMLTAIEKQLGLPYPQRLAIVQKHNAFLVELLPHLHAIKAGIRNKVDHVGNHLVPSADFGPDKAGSILVHMRELMRRLVDELGPLVKEG